ncbi:hypothetical protein SADUNF_Sadunf15G0052800 [Salix dunnii]|uniref:Uncharacterized protein n=1 Tax=Salix dunnii TaxID=1413687 RepID=A0A835JFS4_9ROSI|nr:hypothetical protein SADUNF_Sadunf15G0052800 [Salix dunnii]
MQLVSRSLPAHKYIQALELSSRLVRWFGLPSCSRSLPSLPTSTPQSTPATECGDIAGSYTL